MSSRVTTSAASKTSQSNNSQRRQRSRSTSRYADLEKPKKKKTLSTTTSLVSIPNTIKLSMLNSGLLSFEKVKLEARDANNSLSQTIPDKPIELRHFIKLCEQRRKFPVLYKLEFQTAVKTEANSHRHASRKNNEEKNQNQKCIPYDYNRVVLGKQGRTPDSDYINASYVDSLLKPNAYIVTQGPTEETVNDFWRMIWQEKVSAIIMLTKTFDFTKVMCMQYWPPALDKKERYGDIHIGIDNEEQLANFHIRTFRIWKQDIDGKLVEERHILQFHYTEWHSHTCPFSNAVLEFRRRVRSVVGTVIDANSVVGPMLVHCNDGGGRSGVYMAIDANLELAEEEDCFHVFGYLKKIRQSRRGLIENVDQYKFVYDTLEEHIVCGKTWFSVSELSERLKAKARKNPATKMNQYQEEYAQICKQTPRFTIGDCAGGHRADNRDKNRDVLCVPPDNFRPYLTSFQGNAFTDYINAVFVDGYTKPREYIVTEWPLKHTVGEFWSLVYDQECSAVVVLLQPPPNSTTYPSFWPEKSKMEKYGPVFSVHSVSRKHFTNIKQWEYKINKKIVSLTELMAGVKAPTKTVQLFQLTCFPLGHKVPTSTNSLVALMNMVENWRAKTDYGPVCVVSPDGRSRAGVYCAANACIEQVIQHGEVDIFQAVKTVRRQRPQLVENMMEYKYCYDLVLHYVLHYLNKDLKEKKFIEFGRGKAIPLSPDSSAADGHGRPNTTGKIVVNKRIAKQDVNIDAMLMTQTSAFGLGMHQLVGDAPQAGNGRTAVQQQQQQQLQLQLMQRKKKGRLYSLGGNEPVRGRQRGRLDRLKTVGTFDLGMEMSTLGQVARNLNAQIIRGTELTELAEGEALELRNAVNSKDRAVIAVDSNKCTDNRELSEIAVAKAVPRNTLQRRKDDEAEAKTNYNKIELDMQSVEDITKCCEPPPASSIKKTTTFATNPRKPILRKSKHLTRTDSGESLHHSQPTPATRTPYPTSPIPPPNYRHEIVLQANYDIQIHQEPLRDDSGDLVHLSSISANTSPPATTASATKASTSTVDTISSAATTPHCSSSRIESSDLDEAIGSPARERIYKSADESSQNMSADDIDTVFSDTNELEQLEREYRDILRSNLQREYKSDGDTLDEVGKKRPEFTAWKNQSFENTFEMYDEINAAAGTSSASTGTRNMCNTSTANTSETGSSSKMSDPTFKIKPILKTTSSRESTMSSPAQSSPRPTQLQIGATTDDQRRVPPVGPETKKEEAKSALSLFEKRFGKIRRINNLLKCKRFSTSALYEKKTAAAANKSAAETANSTDTDSALTFSPSDKPSSGESKTSLSSSKLSLFNYRGGRGFFSKRKPSLSNTELNELKPKPIQRTRLTTESYTKSFSDIQGYVPPAAAQQPHSSRQGSKLFGSGREATVPPSAPPMLYRQPLHSPLSEEFYNPTGSCRLSAMELFEKFCSHDFGGLYKNEVTLNLERRGGTCGEYPPSLHEYRLGQRGLGVSQKYNRINSSRLLRQKSEPQFSFRDDATNATYFVEEDDEDGNDEADEEEGDEYEDEYGDEFELEEEAEEEEEDEEDVDEDEEDFVDEEEGGASEVYDDRKAGECIPVTVAESKPETVAVSDPPLVPQYSSDVDEIFLMPAHSKCTEDYGDEYGFENKQFTLEQTLMTRTTSLDVDMATGGPGHDQQSELRTFTLPQNVRVVREQRSGEDGDEVLTIYKMCSKDDILSIASPSSTQPELAARCGLSLAEAVEEYVQNAPADLVEMPDTVGPVAADKIYRTDCLSSTQITPTSRSDSLDVLSSPSCTIRSASNTVTYPEQAFSTATVQHLPLNLDTCSTASRLSLSLKSEIFDDLILTPDEERRGADVGVAGVARSCEFEDFRLTPDDSAAADVSNGGGSLTSREMESVVDKFLQLELAAAEESRSPSTEETAAATEALEMTTNRELVSAFTTEITRHFDELFSRARLDEAGVEMTESRVELNQTTDTAVLPYDIPSSAPAASSARSRQPDGRSSRNGGNDENDAESSSAVAQTSSLHRRMPTRYSMQMLEPFLFVDTVNGRKFAKARTPGKAHGNGNGKNSSDSCGGRPAIGGGGEALADGNGGLLLDGSFVPKRISVSHKLQSNRSQSLGNLSNKTRCFPL